MYAFGLLKIPCRDRLSAQDVFPLCYRLEMIGIDTAMIPTKVIDYKTTRNHAFHMLVCHTMNRDIPAVEVVNLGVTVS